MSTPVFLVMPEWQGSASSRAMQLAEGAAILRDDLPASARRDVPVPLEAGDAMGTPIARLSSLLRAREAASEALAAAHAERRIPILLGGDCQIALPGIEEAARAHPGLAVLWFDAHPDLQHPSTSPSGAATGMTLRHVLGDGIPDLVSGVPVDAARVTLIGTRACDPEEVEEIARLRLAVLGADVGDLVAAVRDRLEGSGAAAVYVHVDLDVLDPAHVASVHAAEPFGLDPAQLTGAVRAAVEELPLAGASISGFAPADAEAASDDAPTVLRILAALTAGGAA